MNLPEVLDVLLIIRGQLVLDAPKPGPKPCVRTMVAKRCGLSTKTVKAYNLDRLQSPEAWLASYNQAKRSRDAYLS